MDTNEAALDKLPSDVLYTIFDYLPPRTLYFSLRLVSKRFTHLLSRDSYYKVRYKKKFLSNGISYALIDAYGLGDQDFKIWKGGDQISWTDLAVRTDLTQTLFGFDSKNRSIISHSLPHSTTVDAIHLINDGQICLSGGRDKLLGVWNSEDLITYKADAHNGWIWDIKSYHSNTFFSCGWDTNINHWALGSDIQLIQRLSAPRAMCLAAKPGLLTAGLQNGRIVLLDPRIAVENFPVGIKLHKGAITGLKIWKNNILTIGEDRKLAVFDIRKQEVVVNRHVNCVSKACPRSVALYRGLFYIGDTGGYINVFNGEDGFEPVLCVKVAEERGIHSLYASIDGLVVGTSDAGIRLVIPSSPIQVLGHYDFAGEVTKIDVHKNLIVAGCSNSLKCVNFIKGDYWVPSM